MEETKEYKAFVNNFTIRLTIINSKVNGGNTSELTEDERSAMKSIYDIFIAEEKARVD